jgi:hypothetical protein
MYDSQRNKPVVIPCEGLSVETLASFCSFMNFRFHAVGDPDNWENLEVFRVGTQTYPSHGATVKFAKVIEWKEAMDAIGERIFEGGVYRHYQGELVTTMTEAWDEAEKRAVVVYRNTEGRVLTLPVAGFFTVVNDNGKLVAKFSLVSDDQERPVQTVQLIKLGFERWTFTDCKHEWLNKAEATRHAIERGFKVQS